MPITIQPATLKYKNSEGVFQSADCIKGDKGDTGEVSEAELSAVAESKADIIIDTASGAIASFPDGADNRPVRSLVVGIEPVQDLHGQESPYPAGGGKNKVNSASFVLINPPSGITLAQSGDKITINGNVSSNITFAFLSITLPVGNYYLSSTKSSGAVLRLLKGYSYLLGNDGSFTVDDATQVYRLALYFATDTTYSNATVSEIQIESGTSKSSFAPYSNICPISGWTGCNVSRTGVNVWDEQWEVGNVSTSTGEKVVGGTRIRSKNFIPILPNTSYCTIFNAVTSTTYTQSHIEVYYDANKNYISGGWTNALVKTTPENAYYMMIATNDNNGTTYNHDISINYPATDTQYHPGHVQQIEYEFPQEAGTVYGGNLTIHQDGTGTLVVDRVSADMGSLNWQLTNSGTYNYFWPYGISPSVKPVASANDKANIICSVYPTITANEGYLGTKTIGVCVQTTGRLSVYEQAYETTSAFKTAVNGQTIIYELATPVTYQLTNQQVIETLKGNNVCFADCGSVSLEYPADTKLYIDKKFTELQALILEN